MCSSPPKFSGAVENRGIYCGLPTYPPSVKGFKALVFGANGISGNYMLRVLSQAPERWEHVVALSRRPPIISRGISDNVKHVQIDLLQDPEKIAAVLKNHQIQA